MPPAPILDASSDLNRLLFSLPTRQRAFVREYLVDLNGKAAAERVGYSKKTAVSIASQMLKTPAVKAAVDTGLELRASSTGIRADLVLAELAKLAFFDIADAYNLDGSLKPVAEMPVAVRAAIVGIESVDERDKDGNLLGVVRKVKFQPRISALDLLMQHLGIKQKAERGQEDDRLLTLLRVVQGNTLRPPQAAPAALLATRMKDVTPKEIEG